MENINLPELLALAVTGAGVGDLLAELGGGRVEQIVPEKFKAKD